MIMKNRRERAKQVRRRKVAALASYSRRNTVKNRTIPQPNKDDIINIECPWDKNKQMLGVKDTAKWTGGKWYKDIRDKIKKEKKEKTYSKSNPSGEYKYRGKQGPWYKLDNRKTWHYETRHYKWGDKTDFVRVPSEATKMYNKTIFRPKGRVWFMEQMVQHKIAKWEKKNPCPVKIDETSPDMFEKEFVIPWKAERDVAIERIRDFVVSIYDKLPLTGRFKESENKFAEEKVAEIKDNNSEGHDINNLDPKKSKLLKKAQKVTDNVKAKRNNLVCTNLRDHKRERGRIILPKAA